MIYIDPELQLLINGVVIANVNYAADPSTLNSDVLTDAAVALRSYRARPFANPKRTK
jgi:hypothetical protein